MSLMVWACFWGRHFGTFIPLILNSVNSRTNLQLLQYLLTPLMQRVHNTLRDAVFMQINAPIHKAAIAEEWLDTLNFQVDEHSTYSSNLNPIEHVWVELKKRLQEQYPKIGDTPKGKTK